MGYCKTGSRYPGKSSDLCLSQSHCYGKDGTNEHFDFL